MNGQIISPMSPPGPYTIAGTIALDDTGFGDPDTPEALADLGGDFVGRALEAWGFTD
ncbi:hypothetical protein ACFQ1S_18035 [Kibdelosporangium lantanae]|uniref:Uncharacterized protein n=1 Tax=Kibdelosporangium lantanae TaxID=1497396 RepID=A0ABW3MCI4_9PSEU